MRTRRRNAPEVGRTGARFARLPDPDQPQPAPSPARHADQTDAGADHHAGSATDAAADLLPRRDRSTIGLTGARFRRRRSPSELSPDNTTPVSRHAAGLTTARAAPMIGLPDAGGHPSIAQAAETAGAAEIAGTAEWPPRSTVRFPTNPPPGVPAVRPYVLTCGRTRSPVELPVEALVTLGSPAGPRGGAAEASLLQLCQVPRSVAELAARTRIPLGVARVLIGDLAAAGALVVHRTTAGSGPDLALLDRVLTGLRKL
jgi:hypothetical protein